MSVSGRESSPDVWEWSRGYLGCPGMVGRPSRVSGNGRKALPNDRVGLGSLLGRPGVVGKPSRMPRMLADTAAARPVKHKS